MKNWKSKTIFDYSTHITQILTTDATGEVSIKAPANNYSIWSIN
ncbi:alpha-amylase domain-containing protein [uncultured Maribacter sp.]